MIEELRAFARDARTLLILTQAEPDPDAIASAYAVRLLLERDEKSAPIVSLGSTRRPETRRMIGLLGMPVTEITPDELRSFDHVIAVDLEPLALRGAGTRIAVIDHHPSTDHLDPVFSDVRPEYGATATMLTEYLIEAGREIGTRLATALLYGIRTDTALLTRGCTRADVEAYGYLQERADLALLNRIDRPAYPRDALDQIGRSIQRAELRDELAVLWLGTVRKRHAHLMPELADLSLNIEGVRWVAAAGIIERSLVVNLRHISEKDPGAGILARRLTSAAGSGGGHATMARAEIPLAGLPVELKDEPEPDRGDDEDCGTSENAARLADWIARELAGIRSEAGREASSAVAGAA